MMFWHFRGLQKHLVDRSDGGGISRFDRETFTSYIPDQGLAGYAILSIIEDRKGRIWFIFKL
ncbi:hypothetical protein FHS59_002297 [Algoriphagus iocasae]|jgi:hypothetical protein|uniref:Uncharacterized protein n=1 Tax=Algoriphagus iocasae TaxID=1836499 RepID=A0A841MMI6_9BACT|nr:hypothetical protein [Algoriphagus iocasae]